VRVSICLAGYFFCRVLNVHLCRHVLSNVGRVAARDSSRTYANINDLFVALCEDDSIYGLFKTMRGQCNTCLFIVECVVEGQNSIRTNRNHVGNPYSQTPEEQVHFTKFFSPPRASLRYCILSTATIFGRAYCEVCLAH